MCGLFGWLTDGELGWNADLAVTAVNGAAMRGPHGWGAARWLGYMRRFAAHHALGPLHGASTEDSFVLPGALIGHCRLATTAGGYDDVRALQPLGCDEIYVAHNGVVRNADDLMRQYELLPDTSNDSEVAGLYLAWALRGASWNSAVVEAAHAIDRISPTSPLALLALLPGGRLLAASRGLPLHVAAYGHDWGGMYLSSRPMPGSNPVQQDSVSLLELYDGTVHVRMAPLRGIHTEMLRTVRHGR